MSTIFDDEVRLGLNHVQVIVKGMHRVAQSDEVHQAEMVMIHEFYRACQADADGLAAFEELLGQPFDAAEARDVLDSEPLLRAFFRSCLFLAYADGKYSVAERQTIGEMASGLGVDAALLDELSDQVRDHLLRQISRIDNVDALKQVADEM